MYRILVFYIWDSSLIYRILVFIFRILASLMYRILALTTMTTTILDIPSPHPIAPSEKTRREAQDPHLDK